MNTYQVSSLLKFDLREAFNSPLWIGYSWIYFLFQFFVYGSIMSTLVVTVHDYFFYYGTGLVVLSTFNIASWSGRRFVESAHEGRLRYILSLPLGRGEFFVEQLVLGVIVNLVRTLPPVLIVLFLSGLFTPINFLSTLAVLTLLAVGIMGLMVSLSVIAFKSFDIYSAIVAALSALLIRFSTISYPVSSMNDIYAKATLSNPIAYGADLLRRAIGLDTSLLLSPSLAASVLVALTVGTLFLGIFFTARFVEGVKSS
ncbi:MAG: ABC transporter permease [Conexivisphaerales archaeon]